MPWRRTETESGTGDWVEVSIYRYQFTIWLTPILSILLAVPIGRLRNTFGFSLLVAPPILLVSATICWKLSGRLWPDQPSLGSPGLSQS